MAIVVKTLLCLVGLNFVVRSATARMAHSMDSEKTMSNFMLNFALTKFGGLVRPETKRD